LKVSPDIGLLLYTAGLVVLVEHLGTFLYVYKVVLGVCCPTAAVCPGIFDFEGQLQVAVCCPRYSRVGASGGRSVLTLGYATVSQPIGGPSIFKVHNSPHEPNISTATHTDFTPTPQQ
jgi:hypothetical protein